MNIQKHQHHYVTEDGVTKDTWEVIEGWAITKQSFDELIAVNEGAWCQQCSRHLTARYKYWPLCTVVTLQCSKKHKVVVTFHPQSCIYCLENRTHYDKSTLFVGVNTTLLMLRGIYACACRDPVSIF